MKPPQQEAEPKVAWRPSRAYLERSRLRRFMQKHGIADFEALLERSNSDPEWFWPAVCEDLGLEWFEPFDQVLDLSAGLPWARWFRGGRLNYVHNCLDRHVAAGRGERLGLVWEGEDGEVRRLTYRQLLDETCRAANTLRSLGIGKGDRVGLFMPMSLEVAIASLACSRLGAIYIPIFSGYGAAAVASRLQDCQARLLITADGFYRRGSTVEMKETADEAIKLSPSVERVLVWRRLGRDTRWDTARDVAWDDAVSRQSPDCACVELDPEDPMMIIYTSGTTGKPKGACHVHGGFPLKAAQDLAHCLDVQQDDTVFWLTDMGWMMGPWLFIGALTLGATAVCYEGTPDFPGPDRLWDLAARHAVTVLGISPTAIRALMRSGEAPVRRHDLSRLRVLGSTGEPWNPESWQWFFDVVGGGRCPIINYSGGTEISGGIVSSYTMLPQKPCSFAGPVPGVAADVIDESGRPLRGEVGELAIRNAWPGMTRGFWSDRERYIEAYWSRIPDVWVHGDWAVIDEDGFWFLQGRSDDTLKIAGKRVGPAEVESAAVAHPAVSEAAAIGIPHPVKGEAVVCCVVLQADRDASDQLADEIKDTIAQQLGKPLRPELVLFVQDLPKTRNAKIMRRVIRAKYMGADPGDLSSLENPAAVEGIPTQREV